MSTAPKLRGSCWHAACQGLIRPFRNAISVTTRICVDAKYRSAFSKGLASDVRLNSLAGGAIFFFGDFAAQNIERRLLTKNTSTEKDERASFNYRRACVIAASGAILNGGPLCIFYRWLDTVFGATHVKGGGRLWPGVPLKIACAQLTYMPLSTATFLFILPPLHYFVKSGVPMAELGGSPTETMKEAYTCGTEKVKNTFWDVFLASWLVWPISDMVNFSVIPLRYRPVWDSLIDVFWTTYLSIESHKLKH